MALRQYSLTLNGSAQRLSTVLTDTTVGGSEDVAYRQIILQADPANGAVVYIGANSNVSSTNHGCSLDPTQATAQDRVSIGPFEAGPVKLSDIWVIGTNAQRLMVLGVPY